MEWLILLALIVLLLLLRQSLVLVLAVATAYIHMFIAKSKIDYLIQDFWFTTIVSVATTAEFVTVKVWYVV